MSGYCFRASHAIRLTINYLRKTPDVISAHRSERYEVSILLYFLGKKSSSQFFLQAAIYALLDFLLKSNLPVDSLAICLHLSYVQILRPSQELPRDLLRRICVSSNQSNELSHPLAKATLYAPEALWQNSVFVLYFFASLKTES